MTHRALSAGCVTVAALAGCNPYVGHYMSGDFAGSGSYAATVEGTMTGLSGAVPLDVSVDDEVGTNIYNEPVDGKVTLSLAPGCVLSAAYTSLVSEKGGGVSSVSVAMDAGQTCVLPVGSGEASFSVEQGQAQKVGATLNVTLSGSLASWESAPTTGFVSFTFDGTEA